VLLLLLLLLMLVLLVGLLLMLASSRSSRRAAANPARHECSVESMTSAVPALAAPRQMGSPIHAPCAWRCSKGGWSTKLRRSCVGSITSVRRSRSPRLAHLVGGR